MENEGLRWAAPGRGRWHRAVDHFPSGQTPLYRALYEPGLREGIRSSLARYGGAASHLQVAHVNDRAYLRLVPLIEAPGRLTTSSVAYPVAWALSRLHPRMRERTRAARQALAARRWREDGRRWYEEQGPQVEAENLALQEVPVESLGDDDLARHLGRALAHLADSIRLHFDLTAPHFVAVGVFLCALRDWGIEPAGGLAVLSGSSPASAETTALLAPIVTAVAGSGTEPYSLDDLRALGSTPAAALDAYLRRHGHRLVGGYDVDQPTLLELPHLVVASVRSLAQQQVSPVPSSAEDRTAALAERVPPADRRRFADLLAEARYAYGLRDDNAGLTLQWPAGLVRRALLEAGGRLAGRGRIEAPDHLFEADPGEVDALVRGHGPPRDDLARRAARRRANLSVEAPPALGPDEPLPPLGPLPVALRRVAEALSLTYELMRTDTGRGPLSGTGVGDGSVRVRARVAVDPAEALAVLEPGDGLVVPFTTPAYNAVLPVVSALVVEEGGLLSHAAIVARELGVPAVIGLPGATRCIPDGAWIELDAGAGTVTLLRGPIP